MNWVLKLAPYFLFWSNYVISVTIPPSTYIQKQATQYNKLILTVLYWLKHILGNILRVGVLEKAILAF